MKRSEIKRRPLADSVLAGLEAEAKEYRELDGNSLYFRVKPDATKSWQLRYKTPAGKWSWLGLGGYPQVSGALARQKAAELRADLANGKNPILSRKARKEAELLAANSTSRHWHGSGTAPAWPAGIPARQSASSAPWSCTYSPPLESVPSPRSPPWNGWSCCAAWSVRASSNN